MASDFAPPSVPDGYTRIVAPIVKDVPPGGDVLECQYVVAPFDTDKDVLDIQGYQSKGGHHSIAYAMNTTIPAGTSRVCNTEDDANFGSFLGGIGGEAGGNLTLPDGVVFRMKKGTTIMLNTHFLNTTEEALDGQTVLDIKFDDVDTSRKVASMFVNITLDIDVAPEARTTADTTCTVAHDMQFLKYANHMHTYGSSAHTEIQRSGEAAREMVVADATWSPETQFNPKFIEWSVDQPYLVKQGDVLSTHCEWNNTTPNAIKFPDEMCASLGFFLTDSPTSPVCVSGTWRE